MKQIVADQNLVFIDANRSTELDCSALLADSVLFVGDDGQTKWAEKTPFTGRITDYDFALADSLWAQAEAIITAPIPEPTLEQWRASTSASRFQARAALYNAGLFDAVEALMAHPDTPAIMRLAWQDAQVFRRMSPTVLAMGAALGLTAEQMDDLFRDALTIEA